MSNQTVEHGITREKAIELATESERPILEILMDGGTVLTNRFMLRAAQKIAALPRTDLCATPVGEHVFATARQMKEFSVVEIGTLAIKLYDDHADAVNLAESINLQIELLMLKGNHND